MKLKVYITAALIVVTLLCAGGTFYYRFKAIDYEQRWTEAMGHLTNALQTPKALHPTGTAQTTGRPLTITSDRDKDELIALLQDELAEKDRQIASLQVTASSVAQPHIPTSEERKQRLKELEKTDPEKYQKLKEFQDEIKSRIQESFATKASSLLDRDVSSMTEEEKSRYELMLNTLNETWQLTEQLLSPDLLPDERRTLRQELVENTQILHPLLQEERDRQLYELGLSSGYTETEATDFVNYINKTIEMTSLLPFAGRRMTGRAGNSQNSK